MSEERVGIRISADGVVETTDGIKLTNAEIGKLGQGLLEAAGQARQFAAGQKEASSASETFVRQLREEAETLGMSKQQVLEYRAAQLGLTQTQSDSVRASQDVIQAYERKQELIRTLTGYTVAAASALAAYAGVLLLSVKHSIDQAAAMSTLSEKTGIAAEKLAALKYAADLSDTSIETLARAMARLPRSLVEGANPRSEAGRAFAFLGIDPSQLKTQEQAIDAIANAIRRVEDPMAKSAALQMILKQNGEELLPFFNNGADGIRRLTEEGERWNKISGVTADQSRKLKDKVKELEYVHGELAKMIAADVVPAFSRFIEKIIEARKEHRNWLAALASGVSGAYTDENKKFAEDVERLVVAQDRLDKLNVRIQQRKQGTDGGTLPLAELERRRAAIQSEITMLQEATRLQQQLRTMESQGGATAAGDKITDRPDPRGLREKKERISDTERLIQSIQKKIAVSQLDLQTEEKLTKGERSAAEALSEYRDQWLHADAAQRKAIEAKGPLLALLLEELITLDKSAAAQDLDRKAREETLKVIEKMNHQARASVDAINKEAAAIEEEVRAYGLSKDIILALRLARLEDEKLRLSQFHDADAAIAAINREIEARKALIGVIQADDAWQAKTKAYKDAADEQIKEQKRVADETERLLGDSMMRALEERGMDSARALADGMRNLFKTLVLRPLMQPVAQAGANVVLNALGMSGSGGSLLGTAGDVGSAVGGYNTVAGWLGGSSSTGAATSAFAMDSAYGGAVASMDVAGSSTFLGLGPPGWIALAVVAAYAYFESQGGGPKVNAWGTIDKTGKWGDASGGDSTQLQQMFGASLAQAGALYTMAGLTAPKMSITGGYEYDPQGTAPAQYQRTIGINGRDIGTGVVTLGTGDQSQALALGMGTLSTQEIHDLVDLIGDPALSATVAKLAANFTDLGAALVTYSSALDGQKQLLFALMTPEEQLANTTKNLQGTFDSLGITMPTSREGLADIVRGLDLTTDSGQTTLATLTQISPAFLQVTDAAEKTRKELKDTADAFRSTLQGLGVSPANMPATDAALQPLAEAFGPGLSEILRTGVLDTFGNLDRITRESTNTLYQTWGDQQIVLDGLTQSYDGSTASAQALAQGLTAFGATTTQVLQQIAQASTAANTSTADAIRTIHMSTLDKTGQYDFLKNESDMARTALAASVDPAETSRLIGVITSNTMQMWNMFSPEEKKANEDAFTNILTSANTTAQERFKEERATVKQDAKDSAALIQTAVETAMNKFIDKVTPVADTMMTAATTPTQVDVTVHVDSSGSEVGG